MQALTATLATAVMLAHALVGCSCSFVEHALGCSDVCVADCDGDHCCCHHESAGTHHAPAAPCKCHIECRSVCIALPREKSLTITHVVAPLDCVPANAVAVDVHAVAPLSWDRIAATQATEPPLRLHLLHQLLLI